VPDPPEQFDLTKQTNPGLLRRIKDPRDENAWSEFDALYRPMLLRFARTRGFSAADSDDVVQYCMTSICAHLERFTYDPTRGRFKSWLRTMVNNRCRDLLRTRRQPTANLAAADQLPASDALPEEAFDRIWIDEHVNHCLRILGREVDETSFTAFQRYVIEGRPAEEVCRETALTPDQLYKIKWRLTKRLRQQMRDLLGDDCDLPA
jgi:RNA polymerase sigma-70 factor (ECF subfamily)